MALLINQIADDLPDREPSAAWELISTYDNAILKLLQRGLSNKEIAQSLAVAEVTIKAHLTKLYRKFGVHTRLELLAYAMTHSLIARHAMRSHRRV
jgi:DNA-binding NarL/FixJ family response regulator